MIARPRTLLLIVLHVSLFYLFLADSLPDTGQTILVLLCIVLAYMHAVAVNDISDEAVDRLNRKVLQQDNDRPLLQKTTSTQSLWYISYGIATILLIVSMFLSWYAVIAAVVMIGLNCIYSLPPFRISARGVFAQQLLPLMYVAYPFFLATQLAGAITFPSILLLGSLYGAFVGRLFLKDIRDEAGDRKAGKLTFLVRHGLRVTLLWSTICIGSGLLGVALVVAIVFHSIIISIVSLVAIAGVIVTAISCYREHRLERQLLDVATIGRTVSAIVVVALIVIGVSYSPVSYVQGVLFQLLAVLIFVFGIIALREERRFVN